MSYEHNYKWYWLLSVIGLLLISAFPLQAANLYKWIDEEGQIRYSDRLPPQQTRKRFQTMDPQGRVKQTKEASKTPEQLRQERAEQQRLERETRIRAQEESRIKAEREHHDSVLMMTFSNEAEIVEAQNERVEVIDSVIRLLKKNISQEQEKLQTLEKRAKTTYLDKGREIPGGLAQNIEYFSDKILSRQQQLQSKIAERERVNKQYAADLLRYRELSQQQKALEASDKSEESNL